MATVLQEQLDQTYLELHEGGLNFSLVEQEVAVLFESVLPEWASEDERRHCLDELYEQMQVQERVHGWNPTISVLRELVIRENAILGGVAPELADVYAITKEIEHLFELNAEQENPLRSALHSHFLRQINHKAQYLQQISAS